MTDFEQLLTENKSALIRYLRIRTDNIYDADDIYQETVIDAYKNFNTLKNINAFKTWLIAIARNKCNDYFRKTYPERFISLEDFLNADFVDSGTAFFERIYIDDIMNSLSDKDRDILDMTYYKGLSQKEISQKTGVALGTVKSRQASARKKFRILYEDNVSSERSIIMKKLPEKLPLYKIVKLEAAPFDVDFKELQGLSIIPEVGEKCTWGIYNSVSGECEEYSEVNVTGFAAVHGIDGVEIISKRYDKLSNNTEERQYIAQMTDTHIRYLSETHTENGIKKCFTFLDTEVFMNNWGFGEDNLGYRRKLNSDGIIKREENIINYSQDREVNDIVGRYTVIINKREYDTVCLMTLGHFGGIVAIEQYIDSSGRTVLWRRFNRNNWAFNRYGKLWSEQLPDNERLVINGETYVHWYDCITDYII